MQELLLLEADIFEFSVKANDISAKQKLLDKTLNGPKNNTDKKPQELSFYPAVNLISGPKLSDAGSVIDDLDLQQEQSIIKLPDYIFLENTQYLFEWVFNDEVSSARIIHPLSSVADSFVFSPKTKKIPARLTGMINTGNDVGWLSLILEFKQAEKLARQTISFEVYPIKMALQQDLYAMYKDLDKDYPLWRFNLAEKTEQSVGRSQQRGNFPLMWLANFKQLREKLELGLKIIAQAPHRQLQPYSYHFQAGRLRGRINNRLAERVVEDLSCQLYDKRYQINKKRLSTDTAENRFIKQIVTYSYRQLSRLEQRLRKHNLEPNRQRFSDSFLLEIQEWQKPLSKILNTGFLKDVGEFKGLLKESLVLQQKTGYSIVYRVWQELKFYLDLFSNQDRISMKSVSEIYEVWCFLQIKQILEDRLGFELIETKKSELKRNQFFELQLKDGFAGAFEFERKSDGVKAKLAHEPFFTRHGKKFRSFTTNQKPDIVLRVNVPAYYLSEARQFTWVFDAKYRIAIGPNDYNDQEISQKQDDYVPDDAINQMHRYRDALIRIDQDMDQGKTKTLNKSRPIIGAFALYPGFFEQDNSDFTNIYAESIKEVGIGAFPLLPNENGNLWLSQFLEENIGFYSVQRFSQDRARQALTEHYYAQEAARIPPYGMKQVFYANLTMTALLGEDRTQEYYDSFADGNARNYHIPVKTFLSKYKNHIPSEIRFLAIAVAVPNNTKNKVITRIWPVKKIERKARKYISVSESGLNSAQVNNPDDDYFLFRLGQPLSLQHAIENAPYKFSRRHILLTTIELLSEITDFNQIKQVYTDAIK